MRYVSLTLRVQLKRTDDSFHGQQLADDSED
jgi:hypothetical protein